MKPPSMENFAVKIRMSGVDKIQVLGEEQQFGLCHSCWQQKPKPCLFDRAIACNVAAKVLRLLEPHGSLPAAEAWF